MVKHKYSKECICDSCIKYSNEVYFTEAMHKLSTHERIAINRHYNKQSINLFYVGFLVAGLGAIAIGFEMAFYMVV